MLQHNYWMWGEQLIPPAQYGNTPPGSWLHPIVLPLNPTNGPNTLIIMKFKEDNFIITYLALQNVTHMRAIIRLWSLSLWKPPLDISDLRRKAPGYTAWELKLTQEILTNLLWYDHLRQKVPGYAPWKLSWKVLPQAGLDPETQASLVRNSCESFLQCVWLLTLLLLVLHNEWLTILLLAWCDS
jgi:hypothetical protein